MAGDAGRLRAALRGWALVSPTALYAVAMLAIPLGTVLVVSFLTDGRTAGGLRTVLPVETLANYIEVWTNDIYRFLMLRSLAVSMSVTLVTVVLAYPVAYYVSFHVAPNKKALWLFLITIPFWTNLLIRTFAINEVIRAEGLLNTALMALGVISEPIRIIYTDTAVLIGMAYVYLPLMVLPLFAAIDRFDLRLVEAAYDLYASRWRVLARVIIPIVRPGIVAGSILVFVPSLGAYVTPRVLGGGKNMMIGNFIELQFGQGRNWPLGSALAMMLLIIVAFALLLYVRATSGAERRNG